MHRNRLATGDSAVDPTSETSSAPLPTPPRRPYSTPTVVANGRIEELTRFFDQITPKGGLRGAPRGSWNQWALPGSGS